MQGRKTPLYETHVQSGGRMVEFGGWLMPVQYTGILAEHRAVREKAGLFDVSHMGEVQVKGPEALAFIQNLITNDAAKLADTQIQYTPMCYPDGGTVDDLLVYRQNEHSYLLVINAANIAKDWQWMQDNTQGFDVELTNLSDEIAELALQGPLSQKILERLTDAPLASLKYYWFLPEVTVAGEKVMVSRTGYTGEDGFEIYCRAAAVPMLWKAIMDAGEEDGILPAGLGARDTLRFEACLPLYGHELSAQITPVEAGIGSFVKVEKAKFNGKDVLAAQKQEKPQRKVVGLMLTGKGVARAGFSVLDAGEKIGTVTTGSYAPTLDKNFALALVDAAHVVMGKQVAVEIRGKEVAAQFVPKPFYKRKGKE